MRPLSVGVGVLLLVGCGNSTPPVHMVFSQSSMTPPGLGSSFAAPVGTVQFGNGAIMLDSKTDVADLFIAVDDPSEPEPPIPIGEHCLVVNYTLPDGSAWGSSIPAGGTAGTITFVTVTSPYKITLTHMQMIAVTPPATGSFFIDGSAEFAQ